MYFLLIIVEPILLFFIFELLMPIVSSISAYWLIPWGVVCLLLAFFLYSKSAWYSNLSIYWRGIFRLCRALLFFLIGVLFIDFVFELKNKEKGKTHINCDCG